MYILYFEINIKYLLTFIFPLIVQRRSAVHTYLTRRVSISNCSKRPTNSSKQQKNLWDKRVSALTQSADTHRIVDLLYKYGKLLKLTALRSIVHQKAENTSLLSGPVAHMRHLKLTLTWMVVLSSSHARNNNLWLVYMYVHTCVCMT